MQSPIYADSSTVHGDGTEVHPLTGSAGGGIATPNTAIQFNNNGAFGGDADLTFDPTTKDLTYSALGSGSQVTIQNSGPNANVFIESGPTNNILVEVGMGDTPAQFQIQNLENEASGGGIRIVTGNAAATPFGISIEDSDVLGGNGISLISTNNGIALSANHAGNGNVSIFGKLGVSIEADGVSGIALTIVGGGPIGLTGDGSVATPIGIGNSTDKVGFFGVTPIVRHATPVTLADVIALLQAYGLSL